ncbi:hypothetical protein CEXT_53441 [Caerostris extrusa]|uniref:Uncharacterized protein n=1 Tax=Caerostris extrusa TaxID=172846 RepID=A0AAV4URF6_CAEEX|nr:hypothetical protein CEXT_53441 [Caerostris extrusa]
MVSKEEEPPNEGQTTLKEKLIHCHHTESHKMAEVKTDVSKPRIISERSYLEPFSLRASISRAGFLSVS